MKPNMEKDFWRYVTVNNSVMESYCIDGTFRGKHTTAQYLIDTYDMNDYEAYEYIQNMKHL